MLSMVSFLRESFVLTCQIRHATGQDETGTKIVPAVGPSVRNNVPCSLRVQERYRVVRDRDREIHLRQFMTFPPTIPLQPGDEIHNVKTSELTGSAVLLKKGTVVIVESLVDDDEGHVGTQAYIMSEL